MTIQDKVYPKPRPRISKVNAPYWDAAKRHILQLQRCSDCAHLWYPPSQLCPRCLGQNYEWTAVSGTGKVWSWIRMWQRYFPGFADELPYIVAYVELDEGPRMMTNLVDVDPTEIVCDLPVEVVFDDVTDDLTLPRFRPLKK